MISKIEEIPITNTTYPFASAQKYCDLSSLGYEEREYYMHGTANVYYSTDNEGSVAIQTPDAPYINRFIVRAPKDIHAASGNVVIEIINPTSFMEIDRMWILGHKEFIRNNDIYIGVTSKPNTIAKMIEFDKERYSCLSWKNPTKDVPFPFEIEEALKSLHTMPDIDINYETGLFWDMLTDLAWLIRSEDTQNPLLNYLRNHIYLTGWSQSACYLFRYVNSFAYRPEVARDGCVFDGYLAAGGVHSLIVPVNQYETTKAYHFRLSGVEKVTQPFIAVQTESENARFDAFRTIKSDSDAPDFKYRLYEVTGASHDTMYSYVNYYQEDEDLKRIDHLPVYQGNHTSGNNYPSQLLFAAAFRNLFTWVKTKVAPNHCERILVNADGENKKDAFGNTIGGLRTCLLNYPTGRYHSTSSIPKGVSFLDPTSELDGLFGYQEAFSKTMLLELYKNLSHYKELVTNDTMEQVSRGFICMEDAKELIQLAVNLAKERGLS